MWRLRAWWFRQDGSRRAVYKALAAGAAVPLLVALALGERPSALLLYLGAEIVGGAVMVALLDHFLSTRPDSHQAEADPARRKADLIACLGNGVNLETLVATEELRLRGWLADGSLQGAFLGVADLQGASLAGADLQRAFLFGADLQRACLSRAKLQGANLYEARLEGTDLTDAQLQGANLFRADLRRARLDGARLQGALLGGADLREASLTGANLQGALLGGATLQEANLRGARLERANLEGARLPGAILAEIACDENTILPDGTRWSPDADLVGLTEPDYHDRQLLPAPPAGADRDPSPVERDG